MLKMLVSKNHLCFPLKRKLAVNNDILEQNDMGLNYNLDVEENIHDNIHENDVQMEEEKENLGYNWDINEEENDFNNIFGQIRDNESEDLGNFGENSIPSYDDK